MTIDEMNTTLRARAIALGACSKGMEDWNRDLDVNELLQKYVENIEFAIKADFPSNAFICRNFRRTDLASHGIYVDEHLNCDHRSGVMILNGCCTGRISCDGFNVLKLYVRGGSDILVSASGRSKVFIECYNHCTIRVNQCDVAKVYVYKKSNRVKIRTEGEVRIREGQ